jgi:hypothetical protein
MTTLDATRARGKLGSGHEPRKSELPHVEVIRNNTMNSSRLFTRQLLGSVPTKSNQYQALQNPRAQWRLQCAKTFRRHQRRFYQNPADDPAFTSILDNPPQLMRSGKRHGPGLIILGTSYPSHRRKPTMKSRSRGALE